MEELTRELLVRYAREAQGIQQGELAEMIGVKQPVLNRFEKSKKSLSGEKIKHVASILNLNVDYLSNEIGNPFMQNDREKIIKMVLFETSSVDPDISLLKVIARYNKKSSFLFLTPEREHIRSFPKFSKRYPGHKTHCALVVQDENDNIFIFKDKKNGLFSGKKIIELLEIAVEGERKYFEVYHQRADSKLQDKLNLWKEFPVNDIKELINKSRTIETRIMSGFLISTIWSHPIMWHEKDVREKYSKQVRSMKLEELETHLQKILPELARVIKDHIPLSG